VESRCVRCREHTRTAEGSNKFVDFTSRWTGGKGKILYIERERTCLEWRKGRIVTSRFVPIDENLRSIHSNSLRDCTRKLSHLDITSKSHTAKLNVDRVGCYGAEGLAIVVVRLAGIAVQFTSINS